MVASNIWLPCEDPSRSGSNINPRVLFLDAIGSTGPSRLYISIFVSPLPLTKFRSSIPDESVTEDSSCSRIGRRNSERIDDAAVPTDAPRPLVAHLEVPLHRLDKAPAWLTRESQPPDRRAGGALPEIRSLLRKRFIADLQSPRMGKLFSR